MLRKRRTREHVIADLAVHHVEGFVLRRGWTVERIQYDYGYDLSLFSYTTEGELEPEFLVVQIKSTASPDYSTDRETLRFVLETRDLETWLRELMPVVLVVYDALAEQAFWLYIQQTFSQPEEIQDRIYVTASIPTRNRLDATTMDQFQTFKNTILQQIPQGNPPWLRR